VGVATTRLAVSVKPCWTVTDRDGNLHLLTFIIDFFFRNGPVGKTFTLFGRLFLRLISQLWLFYCERKNTVSRLISRADKLSRTG
jgi:hypothetical protein